MVSNMEEVRQFVSKFCDGSPMLIAIDGEDGAGKTTIISPLIAEALSGKIVSVDDFLGKDKKGYADFIGYQALKEKIDDYLKLGPVIVEGIMLLKIFLKIKLKPDKFLYVSSEVWFSEWEEYRLSGKKIDEIISDTESRITKSEKYLDPEKKDEYRLTSFRKEMYVYTFEYKPMERAGEVLVLHSGDWLK